MTPGRAVGVETQKGAALPKVLPGTVVAQMVRCGKPGCRCARGELHGPYYYRLWREGGRLRKAYVARGALAEVRAACAARQVLERARRRRRRRGGGRRAEPSIRLPAWLRDQVRAALGG